jgi:glycine/D-amino acid oxidase-like deaminating enzyme/nitrite reductase/ring-hydroxylating ferredoxin subunit
VWIPSSGSVEFAPLGGDGDADVVVVGAGISGLTTALLLQNEGRRVTVIEMHKVATGTTGHTTGKVTSQHGLAYTRLVNEHGEDTAKAYGAANEAAIAQVAELAATAHADCDLTRAPAYVYTTGEAMAPAIEQEAAIAARLGLPAKLAEPSEVPFEPAVAAVRFDHQLHLDAYRYCIALADAITAAGGAVHEHTRASNVREHDDHVVVTTDRGSLRADHVVIATLLPFADSGGFFARSRASRAYGLSARVRGEAPQGMFITADRPTRSVRPWPAGGRGGVIVIGEEHDTGVSPDTRRHYQRLEAWTRRTFDVESIVHTWSAQDYMTVDDIPYVGRSPRRQRTWVATGYRKWGLSNATVGAAVLNSLINDREHPWQSLYDPGRIGGVRAAARTVGDNAKVAVHFIGDWIGRVGAQPLESLESGQGGVVRHRGSVFGAYRDEGGTTHCVSLTCTHLGCTLRWNGAETTWDCPCHGSRFNHDGTVLQGPAVRDLERVEVGEPARTTM